MNEMPDVVPKLPGIQDPFWEQLFCDDTDEILSGSVENNDLVMEQGPNERTGNQQQMKYLTEQIFPRKHRRNERGVIKGIRTKEEGCIRWCLSFGYLYILTWGCPKRLTNKKRT